MKSCYLIPVVIILLLSNRVLAQTGCISGDCINGVGTFVWETGDEYTGQWKAGARTGLGCYDWANGSYYYGYFQNGILEGRGFYLAPDKANDLVGHFSNGVLTTAADFETSGCILGNCIDGLGIFLWETGDMYIGEWKAGARTGYGRYDWNDGSSYVGQFNNGNLEGEGKFIGVDKQVMKGRFINNVFQDE